MIFLRVLTKIFLWPHYTRGPQELGGPGSLNRLNPRFLRHWRVTGRRYDGALPWRTLNVSTPVLYCMRCGIRSQCRLIILGPMLYSADMILLMLTNFFGIPTGDSSHKRTSHLRHVLITTRLHCALASCGAVYCNRSCLWVCDSGRAVSEPYYSQRARSVCVSLSAFSLSYDCA